MNKRIYLSGIEAKPGKSFVSMGLFAVLQSLEPGIACHKLFAETDPSQAEILRQLSGQPVSSLMPVNQAIAMMQDQPDDLIRRVLETIGSESRQSQYFEGTDFKSDNDVFEYQFNLSLAYQLNCSLILIVSAKDRSLDHTLSLIHTALDLAEKSHTAVAGVIINQVAVQQESEAASFFRRHLADLGCLAVLPEFDALAHPAVRDIAQVLKATVLYGQTETQRRVRNFTVAAKTVGNFLESRLDRDGMMIITPGDRVDILLGSLLADQSANYPKIAGIVLTGGEQPGPVIQSIIAGLEHPFPVLLTQYRTYETATVLYTAKFSIQAQDQDKIEAALAAMTPILREALTALFKHKSLKTLFSPAIFLYDLQNKAKSRKQHIVLPEGYDPRILQAADYLLTRQVVALTLLGCPDKIHHLAKKYNLHLPGVHIIDIQHHPKAADYANIYLQLRQHKNISLPIAQERMTDVNYFAAMMVYTGDADGMVSGALHTTADTVRPALEIIKTKPGVQRVSSVFIMCLSTKVLIYGDCAINPNPDSNQLAEIANQAAGMAKGLGLIPKVALLSYSSGESGQGEAVEKVARAYAILKDSKVDYLVEGPLQYDAAIDPGVAKKKLPDSKLAGQANVLIFPDLNTGNNTYKAVQRETGALAIGPVLLGLNQPVNDLSRGCTAQDVINTIIITAIQAQGD